MEPATQTAKSKNDEVPKIPVPRVHSVVREEEWHRLFNPPLRYIDGYLTLYLSHAARR
jgi:hypothetical protein